MRSFKFLGLLAVFSLSAGWASAQTTADTTALLLDATMIRKAQLPDTLAGDTIPGSPPPPTIDPWQFAEIPGFREVANDSTLRWKMGNDWLAFTNREPGVITYRRARVGYSRSMLMDAHESRHQTLTWENHRLNDPVTGAVAWSELPHHKLNSLTHDPTGGTYQANFNINQYYVNKPQSRLNYDEGKLDYRSLDFMVTRNFSRQTNAEISYWLRRDGGAYSQDVSRGSQIYASVYHHLDSDRFLKAAFLHNGFTLEESFGYQIPNMNLFDFDRFNTTPTEASAMSDWSSSYLNMGYYRRNVSSGPSRYRVKMFLNSRKRHLSYTADTLRYKVRSATTKLQAWKEWTGATLYGELGVSHHADGTDSHRSLTRNSWSTLEGKTSLEITPLKRLHWSLDPEFKWRSDGFRQYKIGTALSWDAGGWLLMRADASIGDYMPTPQQLYWSSVEYQGNTTLENERIATAGGELRLHSNLFNLGVRGRIKDIDKGIFWDPRRDSAFVNTDQYYSAMAQSFLEWTPPHFELEGSATWHRYLSNSDQPLLNSLTEGPARIQFKGEAYVKGYVFDRAAYVKAGLFGIYAPNPYRASRYYTPLDIWQSANYTSPIPSHHRLDLDISARVRWIMVHLKWENITDELTQQGYFETAQYPMPGRRFMLGIRVIFNN